MSVKRVHHKNQSKGKESKDRSANQPTLMSMSMQQQNAEIRDQIEELKARRAEFKRQMQTVALNAFHHLQGELVMSTKHTNILKAAKFFSTLLKLSGPTDRAVKVNKLVKQLLIDRTLTDCRQFCEQLQIVMNSSCQPHLAPFLEQTLAGLVQAIANKQVVIDGLLPPPPPEITKQDRYKLPMNVKNVQTNVQLDKIPISVSASTSAVELVSTTKIVASTSKAQITSEPKTQIASGQKTQIVSGPKTQIASGQKTQIVSEPKTQIVSRPVAHIVSGTRPEKQSENCLNMNNPSCSTTTTVQKQKDELKARNRKLQHKIQTNIIQQLCVALDIDVNSDLQTMLNTIETLKSAKIENEQKQTVRQMCDNVRDSARMLLRLNAKDKPNAAATNQSVTANTSSALPSIMAPSASPVQSKTSKEKDPKRKMPAEVATEEEDDEIMITNVVVSKRKKRN